MSDSRRTELARYWWDKAVSSLASARRELEAGAFDFAVNRLYYCVFYAVSAAHLLQGRSYRKHSGVRAAFHREFVKSGLINEEHGKLYDQLFEDRQEGDYVALSSFEADYVREQLERTEQFLAVLRPHVQLP